MLILTHFDETYRAQGQTMLKSLFRHASPPLRARVLWLGEKPGYSGDPNISVTILHHFIEEDAGLCKAMSNRSWKHFCWTLEVAWVYSTLMESRDGEIVFYMDADSFLFADPVPTILKSLENADVALSPHWFPEGHEHRERSCGKFNYGCAAFRSCELTRKIVGDWLDLTLAQCDESVNNQHHLRDWPEKLGSRLAELPRTMNWGAWQLSAITGDPPMIDGQPLISFHGHEFRRGAGLNPVTIKGQSWNRSGYQLRDDTIESVYLPYEAALSEFLP